MKTWLLPAEQFLYTPGLNWDLLCGEPIFLFFFCSVTKQQQILMKYCSFKHNDGLTRVRESLQFTHTNQFLIWLSKRHLVYEKAWGVILNLS